MSEFNTGNGELNTLLTAIRGLADIKEEDLTDQAMGAIDNYINTNFSPALMQQSINQIVKNLEDQGLTKVEAKDAMDALSSTLKDLIYGEEQYSGKKKEIIDRVMEPLFDIFDKAVEKYHSYSIELPMVLADGAKAPTYAHETDAAADLYALEDTNLNAHTYGNLVRTGVKIQLPEGWLAFIMPRSGMSKNTPFRISNSVGLIDSGYRGELGVLLDNTSDSDSFISAGTRIAQLLVMPSYRFQPKIVDILTESDRGETGFGASGNN